MAQENTWGSGTFAPPMPENLSRTLLLKAWVIERFKQARGKLSQAEAASLLTEAMRNAGALQPPKVVLPQSVMQWEQNRAAPSGQRLEVVAKWMAERLGAEPPVPLSPLASRSASRSREAKPERSAGAHRARG